MQKPRDYSDLYSPYLEGELAAEERQMLEKYLAQNPQENQKIEQLKALRMAMQQMQPVNVSDDFDTILRARIQMEKKTGRYSFATAFQGWRMAVLGAATVVLLFVGYSLQNPQTRQSPAQNGGGATKIELRGSVSQSTAAIVNYTLDHFDSMPANEKGAGVQRVQNIEYEQKAQSGKIALTDSTQAGKKSAKKGQAAQVQFTY